MKEGANSEIQEQIDRILRRDQVVEANQTGIIELKTGDKLVRAGDNEILMMKGGGALIVKPDGSYEVSSKDPVKVKPDAKTGTTTLEFGNGSVVIHDGKITEVKRDGITVEFERERLRLPNRFPDVFPHLRPFLEPEDRHQPLSPPTLIPETKPRRFLEPVDQHPPVLSPGILIPDSKNRPEFKRLDAPNPDTIKRPMEQ